jgi:hypothetical protein
MHRRQLLCALPIAAAAAAAACGPGRLPSRAPAPTARSTYLEIEESETIGLVFWEGPTWVADVPERPQYIFDAMKVDFLNRGDRYLPYFLDLVTLPNPFWGQAFQVLEARYGPAGTAGPNRWWEQRGRRTPADDTRPYLVFKKELVSRIQDEMGAFLDWNHARTISAQEIIWGGVPVDGIPPLHSPNFVTVEQAKAWAYPSDEVVGVALAGEARVYPRRIIDWHEMVNDTIAGIPVSLANCTLCGSAILYDGRVDGRVFRFGTSGLLYRSNKLMFDYKTRSLWGQFSGEPAWGPLVGAAIRLEPLPTVHTTYGEWVTAHPETLVLDINTGHIRDYSPGAAYAEYFGSAALMFPVPDAMGPAGPKAIVVAVRIGREVTGYPITDLAERGYIEDTVGDRSVIVVATADGRGGRVYERDRRFAGYDPRAGALVDAAGATWTVAEDALLGPGGRRLARLPGHNAFWFALANHAPVARLWTPE